MEQTQDELKQLDVPLDDAPSDSVGYSKVGKSVVGWTSNLLATAVVVIVALAIGTQLVSSFRPEPDLALQNAELLEAWPELQSCALEFGDSAFQLQRESIRGSFDSAVATLQAQCRDALESDAVAVGEMGEREKALLANVVNSGNANPIEESPGNWRIFQVSSGGEDKPHLPMVVGVRDGIGAPTGLSSNKLSVGNGSRLVVWGLAMPRLAGDKAGSTNTTDSRRTTAASGRAGEDKGVVNSIEQQAEKQLAWTTFVARSTPETEGDRLKANLVPVHCNRTLAIANPNGGSLIGFVGDSIERTKQFYDTNATTKQWKVSVPWQQNEETWSAQFKLPKESPFKGIQVQLHVNHNKKVRGMLMVQPK